MKRKRVPRRIRKQEWRRLGFKSPRIMRQTKEAARRVTMVLADLLTPLANSFMAFASRFDSFGSLTALALDAGIEQMPGESDADLRARVRDSWRIGPTP